MLHELTSLNYATSLLDILRYRAQYQSARQAYIFLQNGETESGELTYGELDKQARAIAAHLQPWFGERALLLYPSGLEFVTAFFGCLYAGVTAVPIYPPRHNQSSSRLLSIANDAQAKVALTKKTILADFEKREEQEPELTQLTWFATDTLKTNSQEFVFKSVTSESLAFLQYTSGSTGTPKGVMVTHGNIVHNLRVIHQALGHNKDDIGVSWLPLFHDMGLIGHVLQPLYTGAPSILMPPVAFIRKPINWLEAISKYRATCSGGPNFAYDLCVKKVNQEQLANLDLSSWKLAFTGAEPVRIRTLEQFSQKFAGCGFDYHAFYPCYGMAENTLFVTGKDKNQKAGIQSFKVKELEQNLAVKSEISSQESRVFVGCGHPYMDTTVIIVNPKSLTRCEKGQVGEIWVSSASVASGYWNRPETTREIFQACLNNTGEVPFLRTGDLGFFSNRELFITGRLKDTMVIRGRNHYPKDIELTVEDSHPSLREHCSAAFSYEREGEERLVVVCEIEKANQRTLNIDQVVREIQIAVLTEHGLEVDGVALLKTWSIPKTSSGKIQRHACKRRFLEGSLNVLGQWQKKSAERINTKKHVAPRTPSEKILANIFASVLDIQAVGIYDNFFELGGDSVLSIQIMDRINKAGVQLTLKQLFQHQTIAELAAVAGTTQVAQAEQSLVTGSVPLLPYQRALLEADSPSPELYLLGRQGFLLNVLQPLNPSMLEKAIQQLLVHHDALRLRFIQTQSGWQQINTDVEENIVFSQLDLSALSEAEQNQAIKAAAAELQVSLSLSEGPLLRVAFFELGVQRLSKILIVVHHLVVDLSSMGILMEDLQTAYQQLSCGQIIQLPPKTTSFKHWAERWTEYVQSEALQAEHAYWSSVVQKYDYRLPSSYPKVDGQITTWQRQPMLASARQERPVVVSLGVEETRILLKKVPLAYNTRFTDVLLTALVETFRRLTGKHYLLIKILTHGREAIFENVDLSRTVGWFRNTFPVLLSIEETKSLEDALRMVRKQLRQIPSHGIGYSAFSYPKGNTDFVEKVRSLPYPEVFLNYQGQTDKILSDSLLFAPAQESSEISPVHKKRMAKEIRLAAFVAGEQLQMRWDYGDSFSRYSTIERLAQDYTQTLRCFISAITQESSRC